MWLTKALQRLKNKGYRHLRKPENGKTSVIQLLRFFYSINASIIYFPTLISEKDFPYLR
jgi:hypothetical protein